jgi:hypothetical protein
VHSHVVSSVVPAAGWPRLRFTRQAVVACIYAALAPGGIARDQGAIRTAFTGLKQVAIHRLSSLLTGLLFDGDRFCFV